MEVEKNEFPEAVEADTSSHEISPTEEQPPLTTTQSHISANTGTGRSLDGGAKPKAAIIMPALCVCVRPDLEIRKNLTAADGGFPRRARYGELQLTENGEPF